MKCLLHTWDLPAAVGISQACFRYDSADTDSGMVLGERCWHVRSRRARSKVYNTLQATPHATLTFPTPLQHVCPNTLI